jgi:hypothetical protein
VAEPDEEAQVRVLEGNGRRLVDILKARFDSKSALSPSITHNSIVSLTDSALSRDFTDEHRGTFRDRASVDTVGRSFGILIVWFSSSKMWTFEHLYQLLSLRSRTISIMRLFDSLVVYDFLSSYCTGQLQVREQRRRRSRLLNAIYKLLWLVLAKRTGWHKSPGLWRVCAGRVPISPFTESQSKHLFGALNKCHDGTWNACVQILRLNEQSEPKAANEGMMMSSSVGKKQTHRQQNSLSNKSITVEPMHVLLWSSGLIQPFTSV